MSRFCEYCKTMTDFFRMRKSNTAIYCSQCCRSVEVTTQEAEEHGYDQPYN